MIARILQAGPWAALILCALLALFPVNVVAQATVPLTLDGKISEAGDKLELRWKPIKGERAQVFRRPWDPIGSGPWVRVTSKAVSSQRFFDTGLQPGRAYEYQVQLLAQNKPTRVGYWVAGQGVALRHQEGVALVVVDDSVSDALSPYLDRFELDLIGDGWTVQRHVTARHVDKDPIKNIKQAFALRQWIAQRHAQDPFARHAVILVGHVPVVTTGQVGPDGHSPKAVPTDLFYADPVGNWPLRKLDNGDVAFWPAVLPANHIRLQIGRIDFAKLNPDFGDEVTLLQSYFDKNHHWRHGRLGDPRQAYAQSKYLKVESNAVRNIVGPDAILKRGHHDATGQGPYLLGVDFGRWKGADYATLPPTDAVFSINFGSGKHFFNGRDNPMTALLSHPWYPLAVGWGGRPSWQLHGLGLGESIGAAHMRTVNNGTASSGGLASRAYISTGSHDWINPPWVNLLGDPTLKPFPLRSPERLTAVATDAGVRLEWTLPEGAQGAILAKSQNREGPYQRIAGGLDFQETSFLDTELDTNAWYMLRAVGRADVYAGSFQRMSQSTFVRLGNSTPQAHDSVQVVSGQAPVMLNFTASDADNTNSLLVSPVTGPKRAVVRSLDGFSFDPEGLSDGRHVIPFTVFDGVENVSALLEVVIETAELKDN